MSALTQEQRERLRGVASDSFLADDSYIAEDDNVNIGDLRALLADADALAAAERERDEARRKFNSLVNMTESGQSFAAWDAHVREREELRVLRAQVSALREWMIDYARHGQACDPVCTCGLDVALRSTAPAVPAERAAEQAAQTEERP